MRNVTLILDDGSRFHGKSFGFEKPVAGEVVFNTAMTGYPESLTDPSYAGQLMTLTYPLVGNYGVPPFTLEPNGLATFMESEHIHAEAIIVSDYSENYSHWNAVESLGDWLKREQIPGITGIDTRELTKVLREHGVMMGRIAFDDESDEMPEASYADVNYVDKVSCKEVIRYNGGTGKKKVLLVDCGVKHNIIRCLVKRGCTVKCFPYDASMEEILAFSPDGVMLSNGPGDPQACVKSIEELKRLYNHGLPIFGICLGHQLMALAQGFDTYKLKYGHRGINHPVKDLEANRVYITSQNHGFVVNADTVDPAVADVSFVSMNDGSVEGLRYKNGRVFTVQFHPEASSGPLDTGFLFDKFIDLMGGSRI